MKSLHGAFERPFTITAFAMAVSFTPSASSLAQTPQLVQSVLDPNAPVERLGRYIRVLASSPRDIEALLGAGQAALDVGDANAALGFYARAEEVSPSNGRVKAGLGSSLVMIERPDDALRLFAEAVSMGVPEAAVARDRGLAYDLRGDSRRAQRDYALAMLRSRDDELLRRYALSLGISGDRAGAMAMLDPLLRKQDQGAWRARAFILAMTGDVSGANGVARQLMVPAMANAMSPLLSRLGTLNAAERAHAVNFGTVPTDGTQLAVQTGDPFLEGAMRTPQSTALVSGIGITVPRVLSGDRGLIPAGEPLGVRPADTKPVRVAQADPSTLRSGSVLAKPAPNATLPVSAGLAKPTPGFTDVPKTVTSSYRIGTRVGTRIGPVGPADRLTETGSVTAEAGRSTGAALAPTPARIGQAPALAVSPPSSPLPATTAPVQIAQAEVPASQVTASPLFEVPPSTVPTPTPATPLTSTPPPTPTPTMAPTLTRPPAAADALTSQPTRLVVPTPSAIATARLAGLLEGIEREPETAVALPNAAELRAARAAAKRKMAQLAAQAAADEAAKRDAADKAAAAKRNPARVWVQVATGRNDSGLGITLRRIRSDNEVALKGLSGWAAPYKATNRILVGPMKSAAAARDLVGKLAKNGVSAMTFNSEAGEEVEKIAAK